MCTRREQLAFAFLTYRHRYELSALGNLHSFMYQLALDNKSLRPVLTTAHDEHYRKLNSSISFAKDVLCKLVGHQKATYFVVDGLDEIATSERTLLVKTLLQMQVEVTSLKVLFSSRAEDDLTRLLDGKADLVRVHDHNTTDLTRYMDQKANELVSGMAASPEIVSEVHQIMKIVAMKADGMFLYARLLYVILAEQSCLDAMKNEVNNLPRGLDAAYKRIIERIESDMEDRARQEANTILELVACSAVPLSKNEIQLGVLVAQGGDPSNGCRSMFLNLIQRCGPIIEEIHGKIQFVHHPAQEYLFTVESSGYLSRSKSHSHIASICVKYLSSSCFNTDLSDEEILRNLLNGVYVLENFACTSWLFHVEQAGKEAENDLLPHVSDLLTQRSNPSYTKVNSTADTDQLDSFKDASAEVHEKLKEIKAFLRRRWQDLSFNDGKNWQDADPLSLSKSQICILDCLERSLCTSEDHSAECTCDELRVLYGPRIFSCSWPGCPSYRNGFRTRDERYQHTQAHQRPFKCEHHGCAFSDVGFRTQSLLTSHLDQFHRKMPDCTITNWLKTSSPEVSKTNCICLCRKCKKSCKPSPQVRSYLTFWGTHRFNSASGKITSPF